MPRILFFRIQVAADQHGQVRLTTMTKTYNVAEAKAQLSRLLDAALAGEDVVLGRAGTPPWYRATGPSPRSAVTSCSGAGSVSLSPCPRR